MSGTMPIRPVAVVAATIARTNVPSWRDRSRPQRSATIVGQHVGGDDAGGDGVFEVVAHVGDPVGPRHHLALGGLRRRQAPRVVADPVERLGAQVQRLQGDVGAPRGVVEAAVEVRRQRVLAGMAAGAVAAVVADRHRLDERHVEAERLGDRPGHLGDLEGVGHPGALVVVGEHEHLGLAGQTAERRVVQDPVAVAFEAGAERVGFLVDAPGCRRRGPGGVGGERGCLVLLACLAGPDEGIADGGGGVGVGDDDVVGAVAGHRGGPAFGALVGRVRVREIGHGKTIRDGVASGALASKKCRSSSTSAN